MLASDKHGGRKIKKKEIINWPAAAVRVGKATAGALFRQTSEDITVPGNEDQDPNTRLCIVEYNEHISR